MAVLESGFVISLLAISGKETETATGNARTSLVLTDSLDVFRLFRGR
jgi:hypothetical protein